MPEMSCKAKPDPRTAVLSSVKSRSSPEVVVKTGASAAVDRADAHRCARAGAQVDFVARAGGWVVP